MNSDTFSNYKQEEIDYISSCLKSKINELNEQLEIIENFKIEKVTEEKWHRICSTPMRYNDILLEVAKAIFPLGESFKRNTNNVTFELNGFTISIPTYRTSGISINMSWYKHYLFEDFKPQNKYKKIRRYFKLIDDGNSKWYELAECRSNVDISKEELFKWWFTKGKWKKIDREKWEKRFDKEDKQNKIEYIKYLRERNEVKYKITKFHKTVDILKEWSEVKGLIYVDGVYKECNVENFLR